MADVWIPDENRFSLPAPSPWWLSLLASYDPQLRVIPSRKECAYRLARVVSRDARLGLNAMIVHQHPDTVMMIQHGLVPVSTLAPWAIRSDKVIRDLMARDLWRAGGADRVLKNMEDGERRAKLARDAKDTADLDYRSGEAFRSLKMRKGETVAMRDVARGRRGATADTAKTRVVIAGFDKRDYKTVSSPRLVTPSGVRPGREPLLVVADR